MSVFVDTSAIYAILDGDDAFSEAAGVTWTSLIDGGAHLVATNYILLETSILLRTRLGIEAVRGFHRVVQPMLDVQWIDEQTHHRAAAALIAANRRQLSLVDLTSFAVMDRLYVDTAFTFDRHFTERGYTVVPAGPQRQ